MLATRFELDNFFSPEECTDIIDWTESSGNFEAATISTLGGQIYNLQYRKNDRVIFDSPKLAEQIWERLDPLVRDRLQNPGWELTGLNERFRVYKYSGDQYFAAHFDGNFIRTPEVEQSWVTLLVYLNEDFDGGETVFQTLQGDLSLKPKIGLAALMTQNNVLHEALPATNGTKYVLRTDLMYRRVKDD